MSCYIVTPIIQTVEGGEPCGDAPFYFPNEGDSTLFFFTDDTFTRVLSALRNGAELTYGSEAAQVIWDFLVNVECPMPICAKIIECIETDTDTQNALAAFNASHPDGTKYPKETIIPSGASSGNILPINPDCDPDVLWSQCVGIVQTANRMTTDFLETWETFNNQGEVLKAIIEAIPGVGVVSETVGVSGIIEYANVLIDAVREAYDADYTLEYEQQLACEIFCASRATCTVSIDQLCDIMNTRVSNALNTENFIELMTSLLDADISGFNVADLYLCFFFSCLRVANLVIPITWGIEAYLRTIATFNTPSDDWMVLCTDCPDVPRYALTYGTPAFSEQVLTFIGYDGDYDVWDATAITTTPTIVMNNGQQYEHCWNVKRTDDSAFEIVIVTNHPAWSLWLDQSGALLNAYDFDNGSPYLKIAQGCYNANVTCRFKVKPI